MHTSVHPSGVPLMGNLCAHSVLLWLMLSRSWSNLCVYGMCVHRHLFNVSGFMLVYVSIFVCSSSSQACTS